MWRKSEVKNIPNKLVNLVKEIFRQNVDDIQEEREELKKKKLFGLQAESRETREHPRFSRLENKIIFHSQSLQFAKDSCKNQPRYFCKDPVKTSERFMMVSTIFSLPYKTISEVFLRTQPKVSGFAAERRKKISSKRVACISFV